MQQSHSTGTFRYHRHPDGGIDYAYYREAADRERRVVQRRFFAMIFGAGRAAVAAAARALRAQTPADRRAPTAA